MQPSTRAQIMLKYIWISVNVIVGAYMLCVFAYFFIFGSVIAGQILKSVACLIFAIVISLPQILYAIVMVLAWIITIAVARPLDTVLTVLGAIVLVAIAMGYLGLLEDAEPEIRRGSSLQSASSVRRRLSGQGKSPSNKGERTGPLAQPRRGSRLTSANSIRNRFNRPSSWRQTLGSIFNLGRWFSRRNSSKSLWARLARPSPAAPLRGRRGRSQH